ncbi:hypothetical protein BC833DRAFT_612582 [Globomyces pollinis-pini]|nr:hypothetical protein BC833DRAFT_612582 [Globomyces pollinis-pini]
MEFKLNRLFTDANGESQFEEISIPLSNETIIGNLSNNIKTKSVQFRQTTGEYDLELHNAPQRQYVVMLKGGVDITTSLGVTKRFEANTDQCVILVEDTYGKGHYSKAIEGKDRFSMFIILED